MRCRVGYLFIVVVLVLGVMSIVGACGRRGPLYLPEEEPATQTPAETGPVDSSSPAMPSPSGPMRP